MLSVAEAAKRAERDPETIRRWIRAGKLSAWKVGSQHMIDEGDLVDAIRGVQMRQPVEGVHVAREVATPYLAGTDHRPASSIDPWLTTIVGRIVRLVDPVRIILFGSRARGDQRLDSDYDLLVILDTVDDRRATQIAIRRSFDDLPVGSDVLVAPVEEVEGRVPGRPMGATYWALQEGRSIYDRGRA